MKRLQPDPVNLLHDIYLHFTNAPLALREKVCEECGMSTPTFYRKMKAETTQRQPLSNAEKESIVKMAGLIIKEMEALLHKYKGN
ncbi:MAG TPA: hypothetical protein VGD35_18740 [Chitinophaga sp.]